MPSLAVRHTHCQRLPRGIPAKEVNCCCARLSVSDAAVHWQPIHQMFLLPSHIVDSSLDNRWSIRKVEEKTLNVPTSDHLTSSNKFVVAVCSCKVAIELFNQTPSGKFRVGIYSLMPFSYLVRSVRNEIERTSLPDSNWEITSHQRLLSHYRWIERPTRSVTSPRRSPTTSQDPHSRHYGLQEM